MYIYVKLLYELIYKQKSNTNVDQSVITKILSEELGGNCILSFLTTLNSNDPPQLNSNILTLSQRMKSIVTFPVQITSNFNELLNRLKVYAFYILSKKINIGI